MGIKGEQPGRREIEESHRIYAWEIADLFLRLVDWGWENHVCMNSTRGGQESAKHSLPKAHAFAKLEDGDGK